ncbi:MAG: hypothetical protein AB7O52_07110 [Planctomycetota bacterium]
MLSHFRREVTRTWALLVCLAMWPLGLASAQSFLRGDVDGDLAVDADDLSALLGLLDGSAMAPRPALPPASDVNDNGGTETSDVVALARYLRFGVPFLPQPFPFAGSDPTGGPFTVGSASGVVFELADHELFVGEPAVSVPVWMHSAQPLAGLELALAFDAHRIEVQGWQLDDSVLLASAAEYVAYGHTNDLGKAGAWLAAAMDAGPPFLGGTLPVGDNLIIARLEVRAADTVHRSTATHLVFRDLALDPPRRNLAIDANGVAEVPELRSATFDLRIPFVRGDVNRDGGLDIGDVVFSLSYVFGLGSPPQCADAADVNDDGAVDLVDAIFGLALLFSGGPPPPPPHPALGTDRTPDAVPCRGEVPVIDVWYGPRQAVGGIGRVQTQANILGRVRDPDRIESLTYSLNGGPDQPLSTGPNTRRLADAGDFVIEVPQVELVPGSNAVVIRADAHEELVLLDYTPNTVWPRPYFLDLSNAVRLDDVAQVVDGLWEFFGDGVRVVDAGYDRLIGLGDVSWTDFQVTARVSVSAIEPVFTGTSAPGPLVGFLLRWQGHQPTGTQPNWGFAPFGGLGCYQWRQNGIERFEMRDENGVFATDTSGLQFDMGAEFYLKMRVETTVAAGGRYQLKAWAPGQPEPSFWLLDVVTPPGDLAEGSLLLVAHQAVATFSEVLVE